MKAMVLNEICSLEENQTPLELMELPDPVPREREILLKVSACGVCHTELDEIEGRTPPPRLPVVLGHQVVGRVEEIGSQATVFKNIDCYYKYGIFTMFGGKKVNKSLLLKRKIHE